jgi:hypothetical protein
MCTEDGLVHQLALYAIKYNLDNQQPSKTIIPSSFSAQTPSLLSQQSKGKKWNVDDTELARSKLWDRKCPIVRQWGGQDLEIPQLCTS